MGQVNCPLKLNLFQKKITVESSDLIEGINDCEGQIKICIGKNVQNITGGNKKNKVLIIFLSNYNKITYAIMGGVVYSCNSSAKW